MDHLQIDCTYLEPKLKNLLTEDDDLDENSRKTIIDTEEFRASARQILKECEFLIQEMFRIHVELGLKSLDTSEFSRRVLQNNNNKAPTFENLPPLKKLYNELLYHFRVYHNLAFIKSKCSYLFGMSLYPPDKLPHALSEVSCYADDDDNTREEEENKENHKNEPPQRADQGGKKKKPQTKICDFFTLYRKSGQRKEYDDIEFIKSKSSLLRRSDPYSVFCGGEKKKENPKKLQIKYLLNNTNFPLLQKSTDCRNSIFPLSDKELWQILCQTDSVPSLKLLI